MSTETNQGRKSQTISAMETVTGRGKDQRGEARVRNSRRDSASSSQSYSSHSSKTSSSSHTSSSSSQSRSRSPSRSPSPAHSLTEAPTGAPKADDHKETARIALPDDISGFRQTPRKTDYQDEETDTTWFYGQVITDGHESKSRPPENLDDEDTSVRNHGDVIRITMTGGTRGASGFEGHTGDRVNKDSSSRTGGAPGGQKRRLRQRHGKLPRMVVDNYSLYDNDLDHKYEELKALLVRRLAERRENVRLNRHVLRGVHEDEKQKPRLLKEGFIFGERTRTVLPPTKPRPLSALVNRRGVIQRPGQREPPGEECLLIDTTKEPGRQMRYVTVKPTTHAQPHDVILPEVSRGRSRPRSAKPMSVKARPFSAPAVRGSKIGGHSGVSPDRKTGFGGAAKGVRPVSGPTSQSKVSAKNSSSKSGAAVTEEGMSKELTEEEKRLMKMSDHRLARSSDPKLLGWLREKDKATKKARAEEKKQRKEKRRQEAREIEERETMKEKSEEKYREWLKAKEQERQLNRRRHGRDEDDSYPTRNRRAEDDSSLTRHGKAGETKDRNTTSNGDICRGQPSLNAWSAEDVSRGEPAKKPGHRRPKSGKKMKKQLVAPSAPPAPRQALIVGGNEADEEDTDLHLLEMSRALEDGHVSGDDEDVTNMAVEEGAVALDSQAVDKREIAQGSETEIDSQPTELPQLINEAADTNRDREIFIDSLDIQSPRISSEQAETKEDVSSPRLLNEHVVLKEDAPETESYKIHMPLGNHTKEEFNYVDSDEDNNSAGKGEAVARQHGETQEDSVTEEDNKPDHAEHSGVDPDEEDSIVLDSQGTRQAELEASETGAQGGEADSSVVPNPAPDDESEVHRDNARINESGASHVVTPRDDINVSDVGGGRAAGDSDEVGVAIVTDGSGVECDSHTVAPGDDATTPENESYDEVQPQEALGGHVGVEMVEQSTTGSDSSSFTEGSGSTSGGKAETGNVS